MVTGVSSKIYPTRVCNPLFIRVIPVNNLKLGRYAPIFRAIKNILSLLAVTTTKIYLFLEVLSSPRFINMYLIVVNNIIIQLMTFDIKLLKIILTRSCFAIKSLYVFTSLGCCALCHVHRHCFSMRFLNAVYLRVDFCFTFNRNAFVSRCSAPLRART